MKNLYAKIVEKKFRSQVIHAEITAHTNAGDRAQNCHGILEPIGVEINSKKGYMILFKCKKCGELRKNKAAKDDDMNLIISLTAKHQK